MVGVIVIWPYEGIIVRYFALMGAIKLVGHPGPKTLITLCLIRLLCRIPGGQLNPTDVERKKDKFIGSQNRDLGHGFGYLRLSERESGWLVVG